MNTEWLEWVKRTSIAQLQESLATRERLYAERKHLATDYEVAEWRKEMQVLTDELFKRRNG